MVPRALWVFPIGYLFASHVLPNGTRHPNYLTVTGAQSTRGWENFAIFD